MGRFYWNWRCSKLLTVVFTISRILWWWFWLWVHWQVPPLHGNDDKRHIALFLLLSMGMMTRGIGIDSGRGSVENSRRGPDTITPITTSPPGAPCSSSSRCWSIYFNVSDIYWSVRLGLEQETPWAAIIQRWPKTILNLRTIFRIIIIVVAITLVPHPPPRHYHHYHHRHHHIHHHHHQHYHKIEDINNTSMGNKEKNSVCVKHP